MTNIEQGFLRAASSSAVSFFGVIQRGRSGHLATGRFLSTVDSWLRKCFVARAAKVGSSAVHDAARAWLLMRMVMSFLAGSATSWRPHRLSVVQAVNTYRPTGGSKTTQQEPVLGSVCDRVKRPAQENVCVCPAARLILAVCGRAALGQRGPPHGQAQRPSPVM